MVAELLVLAAVCVALPPEAPAGNGAKTPPADYLRLSAEARGTLRVEKDTVTLNVFLGGTCLVVFNDVWVLDFGKNEELKAAARKWNGKTVLVKGTAQRALLGFGDKSQDLRQTIAVASIEKAPAKSPPAALPPGSGGR
jgi:hypothetical protein